MNCLPNISISLALLALTAGVWFLNKVQKENLGILYKIAAWVVIIVTVLNLACCGMRCCMGGGCNDNRECRSERTRGGECDKGMQGTNCGGCMQGAKIEDCNIWIDCGGNKEGSQCGENEECGDNESCEGKSCEKEGEGQCKMMKKDSVMKMK